MANSWFRMYAEFATDPKVQMLSEADQRRLTMLFCLRCNGHVTLQDSEVTFLLRISNEEWQITKGSFIAKNFINEANEVLNWDKRQFISDSSAERVARHREKKKQECNVTVTPPDTDTDTEHISKPPAKSRKTSLPKDFSVSERVARWAEKNGHSNLEGHLQNFVLACQKKNYQYVDWDSAFMDAIAKNWANIQPKRNGVVL
jgi:hypothetical protein